MKIQNNNESVPPQDLTEYLLGRSGADACERMDELSVCDDAFAHQLSAAENDLVDAYVRNELGSEDLRQFELHYMSTGMRRRKVDHARALQEARSPAGMATREISGVIANRRAQVMDRFGLRDLAWRWRNLSLRGAVAFCLLTVSVACVAWLAIANHRLRGENRKAHEAYDALEGQFRQFEEQARNHGANANVDGGTVPLSEISSLFLPPPLRSSESVPVVSVARPNSVLELRLGLESDDFPEYQVDLKSFAGGKSFWDSAVVKSSSVNHRLAVTVLLPAKAISQPGAYSAGVWGIAKDRHRELLGEYSFRVDSKKSSFER